MAKIRGLECLKVNITIDAKIISGFIYRDNDISTQEPISKKSILYEYKDYESEYITSLYKLLEDNKTITIKNYG